jgi:Xaa-Pro aminopeptidase
VLWPDQWAAVTYDGSRSAQFEHTMLVTETGVELLTARVGAPADRIVWDRDTFQR